MHDYILLLSDLSYHAGLIGLAEYEERQAIADWLSASGSGLPDPRMCSSEESKHSEVRVAPLDGISSGGVGSSENGEGPEDKNRWRHFLAFNKWMFTVGDPDCYPSVPHGHLHKKTNEWPKLNPYTGRVFSDVHQEDVGSRLSKAEMKLLWNDPGFVELCRNQVLWYSDFAPAYGFPRARFGKLKFPKWR
ncbi:MAG: hypothetical protein ACYDBH_14880 [Acidobacteriaceae bacterium]